MSAAGKSTWADEHFRPGQVLSTDAFRALVGSGPDDQTAGTEAFALLDQLVATRLAKGLTTVVDSLGLDDELRASLRAAAAAAGIPSVAVGFDTEPARCHERNRERVNPLPKSVLDKQLRRWRTVRDTLADEGFDRVIIDPGPPRLVSGALQAVAEAATIDVAATAGTGFGFDLVVSSFEFGGDNDTIGPTLVELATAAEEVGFRSLQVMDHFRQVPQVGRAWEPMLETFSTLAFVAGHTTSLRLGSLVANVEHRNVGLLAKTVATLDVLSGGRGRVRPWGRLVRRRAGRLRLPGALEPGPARRPRGGVAGPSDPVGAGVEIVRGSPRLHPRGPGLPPTAPGSGADPRRWWG